MQLVFILKSEEVDILVSVFDISKIGELISSVKSS